MVAGVAMVAGMAEETEAMAVMAEEKAVEAMEFRKSQVQHSGTLRVHRKRPSLYCRRGNQLGSFRTGKPNTVVVGRGDAKETVEESILALACSSNHNSHIQTVTSIQTDKGL